MWWECYILEWIKNVSYVVISPIHLNAICAGENSFQIETNRKCTPNLWKKCARFSINFQLSHSHGIGTDNTKEIWNPMASKSFHFYLFWQKKFQSLSTTPHRMGFRYEVLLQIKTKLRIDDSLKTERLTLFIEYGSGLMEQIIMVPLSLNKYHFVEYIITVAIEMCYFSFLFCSDESVVVGGSIKHIDIYGSHRVHINYRNLLFLHNYIRFDQSFI